MNIDLDNFSNFIIPKLLFVFSHFIDDLCCLLLSHIGIHIAWLQSISSLLIGCKIIYLVANLIISHCKRSKIQKSLSYFKIYLINQLLVV